MNRVPFGNVMLLAALAAFAGCGGGDGSRQAQSGTRAAALPPAPAPPGGAYDIAIITLDACRPDTLGCFGSGRPASPELDALAADPDAVVFRNHHVQGAWTKSSVASLFTGVYVREHGVMYGPKPKKKAEGVTYTVQAFSEEFETLAERLKALGFATTGIVKSYHLAAEYGFAQGFDTWLGRDEIHSDEERVTAYLQRARAVRDAGGRSFSYVHLNACHHPFERRDRDPAYMEQFGFGYDEDARLKEGLDFEAADIYHRIKKDGLRLTAEDARFARLIYEAKLRAVGKRLVGPLVSGLREAGLYDRTLLIVTADHGEELYDHGGWAHGHRLWEEITHVPLIVKFPRGRRPSDLPHDVGALTQAVDLLPALVGWAGGKPPKDLPGADLFSGRARGWTIAEAGRQWSLTENGWKLIYDGQNALLFHLDADSGERTDVAAAEPARLAAMNARAESLFRQFASASRAGREYDTTLDATKTEVLRSLGYLN